MSRTPGDIGQGLTPAEYREAFLRQAEQAERDEIAAELNDAIDSGNFAILQPEQCRYVLRLLANAGAV